MNAERFDACAKTLLGRRLEAVEKMDFSWFFTFDRDVSVATEMPWRMLENERIVVASEDDGHPFGLPAPVDATAEVLSRIRGRVVEAASISAGGDLAIDFAGGTQLQLLQMSFGYESWRLSAPGGEYVCTGGGNIVELPRG